MSLWENPIFLTQRRLAHRAGVVALVATVLLIGMSLLAALGYHLRMAGDQEESQELGEQYYRWILTLQSLVLIIGGFSRISRTLAEEHKNGLLDSNRLTPLPAWKLAVGYWLGAPIREIYAAAALAPVGLAMMLMAKGPVALWLCTQFLLVTTALFFGLLAVLAGMVMSRARDRLLVILLFFFVWWVDLELGTVFLVEPLIPFYLVADVIITPVNSPFGYGLVLQTVLGVILWRGVVRKFADPFRPAFVRWEAVFVFGLLVWFHHELYWHSMKRWLETEVSLVVHGVTLVLGWVILGARSLRPDRARLVALREEGRAEAWVWSNGGPAMALWLAAIGGTPWLVHRAKGVPLTNADFAIIVGNLFLVFLSFALLLELCRLKFRRRHMGFFGLGLFILYGMPYVLALAFGKGGIAKMSFFSPGFLVFLSKRYVESEWLLWISIGQALVVAGLALAWHRAWRKWLRPHAI